MEPFTKPPLWSARFKLVRAEEHLDSVVKTLRAFAYGDCQLVPEKDTERHAIFLRVCLPKPPDSLASVIGDFLFNVRSALDHIVYRLVLMNEPERASNRNAFPICSSADNFAEALKGKRLDGVPEKAVTLIESLQPYEGRENPLRTLDDLHNVDKHKSLHLTTAVASAVALEWLDEQDPVLATFLGDDELRDGARFGGVGLSLDDPLASRFVSRLEEVKVQGKAAIFVAFDNATAESLESHRVDAVLQSIFQFVRYTVFEAFEPFFD